MDIVDIKNLKPPILNEQELILTTNEVSMQSSKKNLFNIVPQKCVWDHWKQTKELSSWKLTGENGKVLGAQVCSKYEFFSFSFQICKYVLMAEDCA